VGTHVVKVPDIGEGIAEVELVEWRVQPGDVVIEEQILADVMTDKASVEIPSPVAGKVLAIGAKPGDTIAVGSELIRLEVEGAGDGPVGGSASAERPTPTRPAPARAPAEQAPARATTREEHAGRTPRATPSAVPSAVPTQGTMTRAAEERPIASPAVRRRAWELDIDLRHVQGSGPGGRIMHDDLVAYDAGRAGVSPSPGNRRLRERNDQTVVPVIGLRRMIARKMQESKRHIPHFTYVEEVDVTELEALRTRLNVRWQAARGHLTLLPFLMRAIACATPAFPEVNARFDDDESGGSVTRYGALHIGIATQTENGLMVPVVRHAETRDPWSCATEIARLAEAARSGSIGRDELSGSTITITSLGALGGIMSTPVINYPEVAIVGVNRAVERPVIRSGAIVPRRMMNLSSSFDHRVVDGMRAAGFVHALRGFLEAPATMFIE
jgi:2-oxoisovalerate dehydrogenase E2 component (dihydrolipoyl transacylase)